MVQDIIIRHIKSIYPQEDAQALSAKICAAFDLPPDAAAGTGKSSSKAKPWSHEDSFLITYGDSLIGGNQRPLRNILDFLTGHLQNTVSAVHILPFFPFTSDDGFAVSDYETVRADLGDWSDIAAIGKDFRLMADVVINHASAGHEWFQQFLNDEAPGRDFIKTATAKDDVSAVTRPRPTPLLFAHDTKAGEKLVWCTFGPDQVDLDFLMLPLNIYHSHLYVHLYLIRLFHVLIYILNFLFLIFLFLHLYSKYIFLLFLHLDYNLF